jgi:citrate lyase synthetase
VARLQLFIVREDRPLFSFDARFGLPQEAASDIGNVILLGSSRQTVSGPDLSDNFLKKDDPLARMQMELDITLFSSRIALGTTRDFLAASRAASRKHAMTRGRSASRVRQLIANDECSLTSQQPCR